MAEAVHTATEAPATGSSLPQFDPQWWPGQAIWFLVIFGVVFLLMRTVFVPRVGGAIDAREDRISGDISRARALKEQAEAQAAAAEAEMVQARQRAQKVAAEAKGRAQAAASQRQVVEEAKLAETMAKAEAEIAQARDAAMAQVKTIAADTAQAIVTKLSGEAAPAADIEAALQGRA